MASSPLTDATLAVFGGKTRGKILKASLVRFNEHGFDRVTTAQLAEAAGVLEGTLWYHFKAKSDLIFAHLDALETLLDAHLGSDIKEDAQSAGLHFFGIFSLLWDFRYLLRDPLRPLQEESRGLKRLQQIYEVLELRTATRLRHIEAYGFADFADADVDQLATSAVMMGRYWLDYARIRYGDALDPKKIQLLGIQQILTLIQPYLTAPAKAMVRDASVLETLVQR